MTLRDGISRKGLLWSHQRWGKSKSMERCGSFALSIGQNRNYNKRNDKIYVTLLMPMSLIRLIYRICLVIILRSLLPHSLYLSTSFSLSLPCFIYLFGFGWQLQWLRCMSILRWHGPTIIVVIFGIFAEPGQMCVRSVCVCWACIVCVCVCVWRSIDNFQQSLGDTCSVLVHMLYSIDSIDRDTYIVHFCIALSTINHRSVDGLFTHPCTLIWLTDA